MEGRNLERLMVLGPLLFLCAIVAHPERADGQQLSDSIPTFSFDTVATLSPEESEGYDLDRVGTLLLGNDGRRLYLTQPRRREIWTFDRSGRASGSFGRPGEGPGEFQSLEAIGWKGDTLWAADHRTGRVTLFHEDDIARTVEFHLDGGRAWETVIRPIAFLKDGSMLGAGGVYSSSVQKGQSVRLPVLKVSEEGRIADTLAVLNHRNRNVGVQIGATQIFWNQPFSDTDLWDFSPSGNYLAIVERPSSFGSYTLTILSHVGDTIGSAEIRVDAKSLTDERVEAIIAPTLAYARTRPWYADNFPRAYREALHIPEFCPPATDLVVADDGTAWVRREDCEGAMVVQWDVFDRRATLKARVQLPNQARILYARDLELWTVAPDSMGLPHIVGLSITGRDGS